MAKSRETSRHLEVERKFDVTDSAVTPSFDGLSVITRAERQPTQTLEAVYFDTPSHDLADNHVTLRRRTGGPDAGWHLKLPSGPDARTEIHAPLGAVTNAADIPAELTDIVLAIVRDRPLAPVARIATARDVTLLYGAAGALAEFCDDRVNAWAIDSENSSTGTEQSWREWELELVDGAVDGAEEVLSRLCNRLLDAGAAPAGHGSKLAKVLGKAAPASLLDSYCSERRAAGSIAKASARGRALGLASSRSTIRARLASASSIAMPRRFIRSASSNGWPNGSCTRRLSIAMPSRVVWMRASMTFAPARWIAPAIR